MRDKANSWQFQLAVTRDFGQGLRESCYSRDGGRVASGPPTDRLSSMGAESHRRTTELNINPSRILVKPLLGFGREVTNYLDSALVAKRSNHLQSDAFFS
jgi:hypothetical protein